MNLRQVTGKTTRLIFKATRKAVLHPGEALLMFRMAWWVSVLSLAVRLRPLPRALGLVAGSRESALAYGMFDPKVADKLARTIDQLLSVDMLMFKPICWKRAAILHRYLSMQGITSRILFGVRNDPNGKVSGHAWLEADGKPILESSPPEYVVTYSFPSNECFDTPLTSLSLE